MKILDIIKNYKGTLSLLNCKEGKFSAEDSLSLALSVSASYLTKARNIVIVAPNLYSAQTLYEQIEAFLGKDDVLFYPFDEVIRIDQTSSSKEMLSQRLYVMNECLKDKTHVLITHLSASSRFIPNPELYKKNILLLEKGKQYNLTTLLEKLYFLNFIRVSKVDQPLQFALRGDILDIYPINEEHPFRIEFFDDEIESIRVFDITTQQSIKNDIDKVEIFPSTELLFEKENFNDLKNNVLNELNLEVKELNLEKKRLLSNRVEMDLARISEEGFDDNLYPYFNFTNSKKNTILDYVNIDSLIYYNYDKFLNCYNFYNDELKVYFNELFNNGLFLKNVQYFYPFEYFLNKKSIKIISYSENDNDLLLPLRGIVYNATNILKSIELINEYLNNSKEVLVCMDIRGLKVFEDFLKNENIEYRYSKNGETEKDIISLYEFDFKEGFELVDQNIVVLTKREILGYKSYSSRYVARYKKAEVLSSYEDLMPGDYIVHEEHGIGRFEEITTLTFEDEKKDYLKIRYAGEEVLYVPLESFYLVRKFVGKEGAVPKISRLGGSDWKKTKKKIKDKIDNIAERLISIYAERETTNGFSFVEDDEIQQEFENAFPYPLTQDQIRCVSEIKKDMLLKTPMDRLLCGDVGFGKTEVAFRAAFKAILSDKQVAFLCPTTILAKQHYDVAITRFASFGVKIAIFSRFIPLSVQKKQIEQIKNNEINLIIGTHRILSKDIQIPNLGLLIVDEEQRFGVEHKERIKEMSKNIDVLTLTATPIPRTLQMSLIGIRKLSTIDSAPLNRMPIQTYVMPYQEQFALQVIERELSREGQVFYLHNRVSTIYNKAKKIQSKIKNAVVGVVHGKMDKDDIDEIMNAYYQGKINVLVCTSIIETGLDVPNANTMIIEDADTFGLSQLYQIKGRVGRSSRVAYAYLFYNENKDLNDTAEKRLKAIREFTELGSGYKIAQRDLNIRGAGDILGSEQSGFVDTIGMNMYLKIVKEVMDEKKGEVKKDHIIKSLPLSVSGYIPPKYADNSDKIQIYQQIQDTNTIGSLELLRRRIRDIYGRLPKEVEELLRKRKIDILADSPLIESVKEGSDVTITLSKMFNNISKSALKLSNALLSIRDYVNIRLSDGLFVIHLIKDKTLLKNLEIIMENVINIGDGYETR